MLLADQLLFEKNQAMSKKLLRSLKKRKFDAFYCDSKEEALELALSLIEREAVVSWGGSETLNEIGILEQLKSDGYSVIDRDMATSVEERFDLMRQSLLADVYLTSFNALSEDGVLVNIDSVGNRIAAISFGPKTVIGIVGMNKVCPTVEDAVIRARKHAAPLNAIRLANLAQPENRPKTPCVISGSCQNCQMADCICSHIVQTRMCKIEGRIKIILVNEPLGL